ncbi:MAG: trimeric intracellular cation channel family protein [Tepidimonas sp.]|uniref:trimeric intracellular cation channel family protein n=1 Tax=Tepidimonas sp. TaxID=2002775 RepID=UPI00298EEA13|nr:trimeric intracellular cation channel family protein [Tepidimonas sp.]MCS6811365.1 trimeric intracellular cation channel family protein [Tepidimonas sp.]MDW8337264.1 trimeric intracellular cation channel family protein [Tepidimonas sp.]
MRWSTLMIVLEVGGIVAFAMSGLIEAMRKRMDVVGVFSVAFVSAFGGGTVRDILLDRRPLFWIEHEGYLWLVGALVLTAPLWLGVAQREVGARLMTLADACGLGLFAIAGTSIALEQGLSPLVSALMGATTAIVGGVARDVLCNEVPQVYRDHRPYALCALAGSAVFLALSAWQVPSVWGSTAGVAVATGSRLLAVALDWRLPRWGRWPR